MTETCTCVRQDCNLAAEFKASGETRRLLNKLCGNSPIPSSSPAWSCSKPINQTKQKFDEIESQTWWTVVQCESMCCDPLLHTSRPKLLMSWLQWQQELQELLWRPSKEKHLWFRRFRWRQNKHPLWIHHLLRIYCSHLKILQTEWANTRCLQAFC